MRVSSRTELPQLALICAMFVAAALAWPSAPERIPTHWNFAGEVDGYGGKFEGLLLLPLMTLGVYLLMLVLSRIDPGRANYARFRDAYLTVRLGVIVILATLFGFVQLQIRGVELQLRSASVVHCCWQYTRTLSGAETLRRFLLPGLRRTKVTDERRETWRDLAGEL